MGMKRYCALAGLLLITSGCSTTRAWVIERHHGGGVIGYNTTDPKEVRALIPCHPYTFVRDVLRGSQSIGSYSVPTSSTSYVATPEVSGIVTTQSSETVYYPVTNYWREVEYRCSVEEALPAPEASALQGPDLHAEARRMRINSD